MPQLTRKAVQWIEKQNADTPFFLYFPFTSPHAPIVPTLDFQGKSKANGFGDFMVQTDDTVGRVIEALERKGFSKNTIVIFSSDNGPETYAYDRLRNFNHRSMGPLRGLKRDLWEGGHRVPMVVKWPGKVPANRVCDGLMSQIDLFATVAKIVNATIPPGSAEDSYDQMELWLNRSSSARKVLVHNTNANGYAIRSDDWLLIQAKSGGGISKVPDWFNQENRYLSNESSGALYNLRDDLAQRNNLIDQNQDRAKKMTLQLEDLKLQSQVR
jgi:arylsulfatase A